MPSQRNFSRFELVLSFPTLPSLIEFSRELVSNPAVRRLDALDDHPSTLRCKLVPGDELHHPGLLYRDGRYTEHGLGTLNRVQLLRLSQLERLEPLE